MNKKETVIEISDLQHQLGVALRQKSNITQDFMKVASELAILKTHSTKFNSIEEYNEHQIAMSALEATHKMLKKLQNGDYVDPNQIWKTFEMFCSFNKLSDLEVEPIEDSGPDPTEERSKDVLIEAERIIRAKDILLQAKDISIEALKEQAEANTDTIKSLERIINGNNTKESNCKCNCQS